MKTTIDIPEILLRRVKAEAASKGGSMREFIVEAVEEKSISEGHGPAKTRGWRTVFGKVPKGTTAPIEARVATEFETVDPETWK